MRFKPDPASLIILSFVGAIGLGTLLLKLPWVTVGEPLAWVDALFMATSAVCVTGLTVVDVGGQLTRLGQCVILLLVQVGGLGIMTFALVFTILFGVRTSLVSRLSVSSMSRAPDARSVLKALGIALAITFSFEGIGAALFYLRLQALHPLPEALFSSVFHSVSAFCNAGFSLYPDSLTAFRREGFLPAVTMGLIIAGGLGFIVIDEIREWVWAALGKTKKFRFSLHTKIALSGTALLVLLGAAVVWALERENQLAGLPPAAQTVNAFFLSVTARTAGFNTLETAHLTNATLYFLLMYMFIGGCPGSAAGGIKVHTFAIFLAYVWNNLRGVPTPSLYRRKIAGEAVGRCLVILSLSFLIINLAAFLFQVVENLSVSHRLAQGRFLELVFETTSAFGTVGLTTGVTPQLGPGGKLLTALVMLAGRIGPLTLWLAILAKRRKRLEYEYVQEDVMIG